MSHTEKKWDDEACAAACIEMNRMRALIAELDKEAFLQNKIMNADGRSISWETVSDMKRVNMALARALNETGNESDELMEAAMNLKINF